MLRLWFKLSCVLVLAFCLPTALRAEGLEEKLRQELQKMPHPSSAAEFEAVPHLACLNQGKTSVCWSYATCSFLESEMARLKREPVRLSMMYPAYCQYLEKARRFVRTQGESRFSPGDLFTGVLDTCREYGAMPASVYGEQALNTVPDQSRLYAEVEGYMQEVKQRGKWNEHEVLARVRKILNRHLGEPPKTFFLQAKSYTPKAFAAEAVALPWADYVMLTSFESAPFNTFAELKVPDNWRRNTNYFNVPLPVFYQALSGALKAGYSAVVSMDITEPAYRLAAPCCWIPEFDIPACNITQEARELRFREGSTTDDHAIHLLGCKSFGAEEWFLAKDSWKTAWREGNRGALFLNSAYVKLKVLAFLVHRDAICQTVSVPVRAGG